MRSFEHAYERIYPDVVRSAWSICRDPARAEELAQEAFVRAYRRWNRIERGGYADAWVHRAAMNLALTHVQRAKRGRLLETFGFAPPPEEPNPFGDDRLVALLDQLPRRQREAVFLRVVTDLSEEEVASVMGCSPGSVKVHKKRGLDRLRTLLEGRDDDARATAQATSS